MPWRNISVSHGKENDIKLMNEINHESQAMNFRGLFRLRKSFSNNVYKER
jgi:hypothetical protein